MGESPLSLHSRLAWSIFVVDNLGSNTQEFELDFPNQYHLLTTSQSIDTSKKKRRQKRISGAKSLEADGEEELFSRLGSLVGGGATTIGLSPDTLRR